jgi:hypothetical protein
MGHMAIWPRRLFFIRNLTVGGERYALADHQCDPPVTAVINRKGIEVDPDNASIYFPLRGL